MEKKLKFKLNKKIGVFIILAIILIASIIGVLFYNKFEFNIMKNEREEAKAGNVALIQEWTKSLSSSYNINSVCPTSDGGYLVVGSFTDSTLNLGNNIILNKKGSEDALIIKYNSSGIAVKAQSFGGNGSYMGASTRSYVYSLSKCIDSEYYIGICFFAGNGGTNDGEDYISSGLKLNRGTAIIMCNSSGDILSANRIKQGQEPSYKPLLIQSDVRAGEGVVIAIGSQIERYYLEGDKDWSISTTAKITKLIRTSDGYFIIADENGRIAKYAGTGTQWSDTSSTTEITAMTATSDGGCILARGSVGYKFDGNGNKEYFNYSWGDACDKIVSIVETNDGGFLLGNNCTLNNYSTIIKISNNSNSAWEWSTETENNPITSINLIDDKNIFVNISNRELVRYKIAERRYTITLNNQSATTAGSTAIYE